MSTPTRVVILGSTGSIGRQAVDVALRFPDSVRVVGLAANRNAELLAEQAVSLGVRHLALTEPDAAARLRRLLPDANVRSGYGVADDLADICDAGTVLNALVGATGLRATLGALTAGRTLALANKESLVVAGELVMPLAKPGQLIPVDSEHSAIFQCLTGESTSDIRRVWLTASGGPFRGWTRTQMAAITCEQALAHPTWAMGPKITIDSATLMNKGLEVIEAHHLFGIEYDSIRVVVHPQSCIHSMVEFEDGSVKAHLGATDMRIPIQYAFSHPRRWAAPVPPVDFAEIARLDFEKPDLETFGCLDLAFEAGRAGGSAPVVLNAANEVAVAAFLESRCSFLDIEATVRFTLDSHERCTLDSVDHIEEIDRRAREVAASALQR